ncbi:MAG: hypothetical protein H5T71_07570 [Chloroflexi bacterium]|nr:hypothetical protein [Chloroflexota bacterium]
MNMATLDAETRKYWQEHPDEIVSIIVRFEGDAEARTEALQKMGVEIKRRYRLTSSISGTCPARVALKVARLSWVKAVDADRKLRIFGR